MTAGRGTLSHEPTLRGNREDGERSAGKGVSHTPERRHFILTALKQATALAIVGLCASACASSATPQRSASVPPSRSSSASRIASRRAARPATLRIGRATWALPAALSREVVFAVGGSLEVAGGLRADGTTTATVLVVDPRTGRTRKAGPLAVAAHDAAGGVLGGRRFLFGGGAGATESTVQHLTSGGSQVAASLPEARSDLVAASVGDAVYLLGGYDGTSWVASVLRTVDGRHFSPVARLPVPVRYPAVATVGSTIWLFGGQAQNGPTSVVQRIDVTSGHAQIAGRMRHPLTDASAVVLGGRILVCGGAEGGQPTSAVRRFDPRTLRFSTVGHLPLPVQDAGSAVLDGVAYLVGGETPSSTAAVQTLRLVGSTGGGGA